MLNAERVVLFCSERMFGLFLHETYYPDEQRRSDDSRYRFSYPVAAGRGLYQKILLRLSRDTPEEVRIL